MTDNQYDTQETPIMVDAANPPQTGNADATANPYAAPNQNVTGGKKLSPLKGPGPGIASLAIAGGSILLEIVCALLGDMPCMALLLPIVALVLGIVGVAQNRRKKGIAIAGIILSVVAMIVTFLVFVSVMITAWNSVQRCHFTVTSPFPSRLRASHINPHTHTQSAACQDYQVSKVDIPNL